MLDKKELLQIVGGFSFTASFLNAIARGITTFMDVGRAFGSSLRRAIGGSMCSV